MLINTYNNQPNDIVDGLASMEQFMEMQDSLMKENENIIVKFGLLELEESNNRLQVNVCFCILQVLFSSNINFV